MAEMRTIRRTYPAVLAAAACALALPASAPATLSEVGLIPATIPATVPSCPATPCLAVARTTGFQVKVGRVHNPLIAPAEGSVVAWTIQMGKPTPAQIKYFNANEGGPAEAGIAILRPQPKVALTYKLIAKSPLIKLQPYFGKTAEFPLETTIKVDKGDIVALTVPTWAPALAPGFGNDTSWRASRPKTACTSTSSQTVQSQIGSSLQYFCLYQTARLTYSATLISTP
ncbi:MAG TPA: hypothetical protein VKG62_02715 [Solirubrobacteraceae bacterium]|nr:hypothetical protein [Solirubrobacteraceae bacterium]